MKKSRTEKKTTPARSVIDISGDRIGERFEAELAAIARALKGSPFVVAGNCLRVPVLEFDRPGRTSGMVTTRLRTAIVQDLRREARKRVRFFRIGPRSGKSASIVPRHHFEELIRRARHARMASICAVWLRLDPNGRVIASSPSLHFGQTPKFGNGISSQRNWRLKARL